MMGRSSRTPLLVAAAALLVAANIWWFWPGSEKAAEPLFKLADTNDYGPMGGPLTVRAGTAELNAAPIFDPSINGWRVAGRQVNDLRPYMTVNSGGYSPTDSAPFLLVRFRAEATADEVRRALLSLAEKKICLVALPDAYEAGASERAPEVAARRIVSVLDDAGKPVTCPAPPNPFGHQSPAAASSASI
ncbi:hypothetical protein [Novosphingobium guangzhouense]|uniref:Uncharacterized protein n=1 Tax=Novosphingobium guangzhouense TaxID=1850347 RepID=A0A2K2G271_9SPHN|nr:hypothetical protein [Novosphingobium guangzhouense]PNU05124.1 hypothetical protein A8V01_04725 [Novosphingobium guangzhouense]